MPKSEVVMPNTDVSGSYVDKIAMRIPSFWSDQPRLFFEQLEANFKLSGITAESTK